MNVERNKRERIGCREERGKECGKGRREFGREREKGREWKERRGTVWEGKRKCGRERGNVGGKEEMWEEKRNYGRERGKK